MESYYELYNDNETAPDFPFDEYCETFVDIVKLLGAFLDDLSEQVYKLTTFKVELLIQNGGDADSKFLTIKLVVDYDLYKDVDVAYVVDDDDDQDEEKQEMDFYEEDEERGEPVAIELEDKPYLEDENMGENIYNK